jgi:tmRNA-binding protein
MAAAKTEIYQVFLLDMDINVLEKLGRTAYNRKEVLERNKNDVADLETRLEQQGYEVIPSQDCVSMVPEMILLKAYATGKVNSPNRTSMQRDFQTSNCDNLPYAPANFFIGKTNEPEKKSKRDLAEAIAR